jgi:hypothetical protein
LWFKCVIVASEWNGLEVNAGKTQYIVMYRNKIAGRSHSTKSDNSYCEMAAEFKFLGKALTNQNSSQEEIKSRLKSGNACYHLVQNLLFSSLLSRNIKIKICRAIILPHVLYGRTH